jgi:transcriptional regulator with XRE-family HTH domain
MFEFLSFSRQSRRQRRLEMSEIGQKLLMIRRQRGLSLRQVERLTDVIANRYGDKGRRVSASWLGRIERENHSIAHERLESLEEVYGVAHEYLINGFPAEDKDKYLRSSHFSDVPADIFEGPDKPGIPLIPSNAWLARFPSTTLLPSSQASQSDHRSRVGHRRDTKFLYGVIGTNDTTLVPFVQPGALVEIDSSARTISSAKIFYSTYERPIYFLLSHDGYHCGWCQLDADESSLTLVHSTMTIGSHLRWRYRQDVEVVGTVNRVLTRLGFPKITVPNRFSPLGQ